MITAGQEYINSRDVVAKRENCARLTADLWERLLPIHINEIFINNRVCRTAIYEYTSSFSLISALESMHLVMRNFTTFEKY